MGAGLLVFVLSIVVFIPLFIGSIVFFIKTKKSAYIESGNIELKYGELKKTKIELFTMYAIGMMSIYYEYWLTIISTILVDTGGPSLKYYFLKALFEWDNWEEILVYWASLLTIYVLVHIRLYVFNKSYGINLYKNNNYLVSIFIIGLYPFMVLSFLNWAIGWDVYNRFNAY